MPQCFRFGVLYAKNGQVSEAEMYDNGNPASRPLLCSFYQANELIDIDLS